MATAQNLDVEMDERIRRHQEERGAAFQTIEEPLDLSSGLQNQTRNCSIVIVDCLTLWVSNLLGAMGEEGPGVEERFDGFLSALRRMEIPVILIGNEVGWGIVPDNPLSRTFRDMSGRLHQAIGQIADQVILMVAGLPLVVKGKGK